METINILYQNLRVTDKAYRDNVIIDSYHSATIEGASTADNVKRALESKKGTKADRMVVNSVNGFYFAYIHPFCDGNGKTVRILMSAYLDKTKYRKIKAVPISRVINENLSGYYKSLLESEEVKENNNGKLLDITPFIVYLLNVMEQALISAIAAQNALNDSESHLIIKMKKNKGAEITIETLC